MQAILNAGLPMTASQKEVKINIYLCKNNAKAKTIVILYLVVPRVRNDQCKQF